MMLLQKAIHHTSLVLTLYVLILILGPTEGDDIEWKKCKEMPVVHFPGVECPYWCTDNILYELACKPDGVSLIQCSGSDKNCPKYFHCRQTSCVKSPCYEPDRRSFTPFMHNLQVCMRNDFLFPDLRNKPTWEDNYDPPTVKPWHHDVTTEKPYSRTRKTDLISAVLPVMLIMIVVVTIIMVLRAYMRRRQARRFQATPATFRERRVVHNEPLISNNRFPKPNVTMNPICAGARPPPLPTTSNLPGSQPYGAQPSAPYPTLNYPHSAAANVIPYSHYGYPNSANAMSSQTSQMPEMPPNYSPHSENQAFPDTAPPSYFEAIGEVEPTTTSASNRSTNITATDRRTS